MHDDVKQPATLAERAAAAKVAQAAEFEQRRLEAEQRQAAELEAAAVALLDEVEPELKQRFGLARWHLVDGAPIARDRVYVQPLGDESVVFAIVRDRQSQPRVYLAEFITDTAGERWGYTQSEVRDLLGLGTLLEDRARALEQREVVDDVPATPAGEAALEAAGAAVQPSGA